MKRLFLFLLVGFFLIFTVGCGTGNTTSDSDKSIKETNESTKTNVEESETRDIILEEQEAAEENNDEEISDHSSPEAETQHDEDNKDQNKNETDGSKQRTTHSNITTKDKQISADKSSSQNKNDSASRSKNIKKSKKQDTKQNKNNDKSKENKAGKDKTTGDNDNNKKGSDSAPPKEPEKTVTVEITTGDVKGTVLPKIEVELKNGDTALDVTQRILKTKSIQISVRGAKASAYVEGIDNLYEFDKGPMSGWHIRVNGKMIDRSAGVWDVNEGDRVNWNYTVDYTKDSEDW